LKQGCKGKVEQVGLDILRWHKFYYLWDQNN